jgi:hypothetical protein
MRCNSPCPLYSQQRPQKRTPATGHVRCAPKSGHVRCSSSCLLWANNGHHRKSQSAAQEDQAGHRRALPSSFLRFGSIAIDEGYQLFGRLGEQLEFSRIQRLAQELKEESIRAIQEGWPQAAEEEA